jgi:hypothetical protein
MPQLARRPVGVIRGYRRLLVRLGRAYEHKGKNERHAWAHVFMALADFLVENGLVGRGALWLQESASTLTDPEGSKALPSKTWRRFALVSLGMRALTIDGISREEAARRAVRSVKGTGDAKTVLQRYDALRKGGGVKNREARYLFHTRGQLLPKMIEREGAASVAKFFFDAANIQP